VQSPQAAGQEASSHHAVVEAMVSELSRRVAGRVARRRGQLGPASSQSERPAALAPFGEIDRELVERCRERGPLRAALARIAARMVEERGWERLGFARLSDYATECLGLSGRSVRSLGEVGARLGRSVRLEAALTSGELGWTKVRLLARLPEELKEAAWIAWAGRVTAETLSKAVRAVDRGSVERGAAADETARSRVFEVRCTPEVRWKWGGIRAAASRAAGRVLHISEAAELVAAEVLSALPIDERDEDAACFDAGTSFGDANPRRADPGAADDAGAGAGGRQGGPEEMPPGGPFGAPPGGESTRRGWDGPVDDSGPIDVGEADDDARGQAGRSPRPVYPSPIASLLEGLDEADPFELDERLRRAVSQEQRLDARIGPHLAVVWRRFLHQALGYSTRESYARERLGMDPTRARALIRLERLAEENEAFASAYRDGSLSWVGADTLAPLVRADPLGRFVGAWVAWAGQVTVRRLRADVEDALTLREVHPSVFRQTGGLPAEARTREGCPADQGDREIGATAMGAEKAAVADPDAPVASSSDREIGATAMGAEEAAVADPDATGVSSPDREIGATAMGLGSGYSDICLSRHPEVPRSTPGEVCWARFIGPPDVVQLFRAVLNTVRRRMERESGRLPTAGEALGAMLDHVNGCWGFPDEKTAARYKVFNRDGWRCSAPGCTAMQNLHDHHIHFRSAGGPDDLDNRITLCAFHHLRGVHAGLLRCVGRAPDGLRWEMGIRPGVTPRMAYRSGDIRVRSRGTTARPPSRQVPVHTGASSLRATALGA